MKAALLISILIAIAFVGVSFSSASACVPADSEDSLCMPPRQLQSILLARTPPVKAATASAAPVPVPVVARGTSPSDAMEPGDAWLTIKANSSLWYKIGSGIDPQRLEVWLDTHKKENVNFAVYSPEQMNDWSPATAPKGRGAYDRTIPDHDLQWIGQSPAGGTWFVLLTNGNAFDVSYRLTYNRIETGRKSCNSYWEPLYGTTVWWTQCK